jgi:hypothetical protein
MTNIVDSIVVYTNLAFHLMLGEASHATKVLSLPLPTPIPAAAVSSWTIAGLRPELSGNLNVSNYSFFFEEGYLTRIAECTNSFFVRGKTRPQIFLPSTSRPPPAFTMTDEAAAVLARTEKRLADLGLDVAELGPGASRLVTRVNPPKYWLQWRRNERFAQVELTADGVQLLGLDILPVSARAAYKRRAIVSSPLPAADLQTFGSSVSVDCGLKPASDEQVRGAIAECYSGLRQQLDGRTVQLLLVQDNLDRKDLLFDEVAKLDPNAVCLSIDWANPPVSFPVERMKSATEKTRGIRMVAISGTVEVKALSAPFLANVREQTATNFEEAVNAEIPGARELLQSLGLRGIPAANHMIIFPAITDMYRVNAFEKVASEIATVNFNMMSGPLSYVTSMDRRRQTNVPLLLTITGNLPSGKMEDYRIGGPQLDSRAFEQLGNLIAWRQNPFGATYRSLGEEGLSILYHARTVETFRLWMLDDRRTSKRNGQPFEEQFIRTKGPPLNVQGELRDLLLQAAPEESVGTMCIYDPGLAFRISSSEGSINMVICFTCSDLRWTVRDRAGKAVASGGFRPSHDQMKMLRKIGLRAFPNFKELRERDRD